MTARIRSSATCLFVWACLLLAQPSAEGVVASDRRENPGSSTGAAPAGATESWLAQVRRSIEAEQ